MQIVGSTENPFGGMIRFSAEVYSLNACAKIFFINSKAYIEERGKIVYNEAYERTER